MPTDHELPFAAPTDFELPFLDSAVAADEANGDALLDPLTGELIELTANSLIDAFERLDRHAKHVNAGLYEIRRELLKLAQGDAKTRRLRHADGRTLVLTMPAESFDQAQLKSCWNAYPNLRDELLRVERLAVNLVNWKKAAATTGDPAWMNCVKMIESARRPATAPPSVRLEQSR